MDDREKIEKFVERYGTSDGVMAIPSTTEENRDITDQFRNAYPEFYEAARSIREELAETPFDRLTLSCLVFLEERTRSPECDSGFARGVREQIVKALRRKSPEWTPKPDR